MAPGKVARRVSYVIPEPTLHPTRLQLPRLGVDRHGSTTPLLIPVQSDDGGDAGGSSTPLTASGTPNGHPRHRLGVNSLALDTSTQLAGRPTPEGILYSGGRDGMIIAHELGITHKKRAHMAAADPHRWETLVGFHNNPNLHTEEEPGPVGTEEIPYTNAWEIDMSRFEPGHVRPAHSDCSRQLTAGSQLRFVSQYRLTQIGSMISSSVITIAHVRIMRRVYFRF